MVAVQVRVFTHSEKVSIEHAYLLGSSFGGLSDILDTFNIDEQTCTIARLRSYVELGGPNGGASAKRTILFREILHECENSKNFHCWDDRVRRSSYRIGFLSKNDQPVLVPLEMEAETIAVPFIRKEAKRNPNLHAVEIVIVPLSQVGPGCGSICNGCLKCTQTKLPESNIETSYFLNGKIYKSMCNDVLLFETQ